MSTEQRVIASKPKVGARSSAQAAPATEQPPVASKKGSGRRLLGLVLVAVVVLGAGGYWFLLRPAGGEAAAAVEAEPETLPGVVQVVEPVSINLAAGRYLRLGLGLQLPAELEEELDPSKALDTAISVFSGRTAEEVGSAEGRELFKAELTKQLAEAYHGEVLAVYLTEYVTQ